MIRFLFAVIVCIAGQIRAEETKPAEIDALVANLGDKSFRVREAAYQELLKLGEESLEQLSKAEATSGDAEAREKLRSVIRSQFAKSISMIRSFESNEKHLKLRDMVGASLSPDGRFVVVRPHESILRCWNVDDGSEIRIEEFARERVGTVKFSCDGSKLAVAYYSGALTIWDFKTRKKLVDCAMPKGGCYEIDWSQDGNKIIAGGMFGHALLFDAGTGRELNRYPTPMGTVFVAMRGDGRQVAISGIKVVQLYDADSPICRELTGHGGQVISMNFSTDQKLLATSTQDKFIRLFNVESGKQERTIDGESRVVFCASLSKDGRRVLSSVIGGNVRLSDVGTGQLVCNYTGHTALVARVQFSDDGRRAMSADADGCVKIWKVPK